MSATQTQLPNLMALADAVLARNIKRNTPSAALAAQGLPSCVPKPPIGRNAQLLAQPALPDETVERNKKRNSGATGATEFAAEADENAAEYVAERSAICAADGLPPAMLRGVFTCTLRGNPPFTLLGVPGATLQETADDLRRQFGADFEGLTLYRPKSAAPIRAGATISTDPLPEHGGKSA